jgi:hypothetical protein
VNELKLHALTCPQCGAPGVVREGTRITKCERCGALLCLSEVSTPRYEALANMTAAQAAHSARVWLDQQRRVGMFGRPELVLIPFHEVSGRRVGVFERRVPERIRVHRRVYDPQSGGTKIESDFTYKEKEDTKVMVSDVQQMTPAARTPWDLKMFDPRAARSVARLGAFDLVEAQRRSTVYAAEQSASAVAERRFGEKEGTELVAASRRTIYFPFWSIPVETGEGSYEVVLEAITGKIIAWRMPQPYPSGSLKWAALAVPGALILGHGLNGLFFGGSVIDPMLAAGIGLAATFVALLQARHPDWALRSWPGPETIPRLERDSA